MIPASTNGGGQTLSFPDTCMTPGVSAGAPGPLPYPNIAMLTQAKGGTCSDKVKMSNKKTVVHTTEISMTSGDEAGNSPGGVVSSKFKGPAKFKSGSSKVKAEGKKVVYLGCMIGQNGSNANMPAGTQIAPSQTKVTVMP
jgi:hypothetical protein